VRAERHHPRALLSLLGLLHIRLRSFRCPHCGSWAASGAATLALEEKQRQTKPLREWIVRFELGYSYPPAATSPAEMLRGAKVSAKALERLVLSGARKGEVREEESQTQAKPLPFQDPTRRSVRLDGTILVRGRKARELREVQVGSLGSTCRDVPQRAHPWRGITDKSLLAGAKGWETFGWRLWRAYKPREGEMSQPPEALVLGDGASGIQSLRERHFPDSRGIQDPWHLHETVQSGSTRGDSEGDIGITRESRRLCATRRLVGRLYRQPCDSWN
jgi:hypothetical protein